MEKQRIYTVCWNITRKCNENCSFCYRTIANDLSLENNKIIADKLIDHGVEKITFAGGEPLLYEDLFTLAEYIKNKNPNIILSLTTNGMLIDKENALLITKLFDWITLDIESNKSSYHELVGRGKEHLNKTKKNLKYFSKKINVKVNTVATRLNIKDIPKIYKIIEKYNVERWKIFRYYSITYKSITNKDIFSITNEQFRQLKDGISKMNKSETLIDFNDTEDFETTYFSIFPDGSLKDNKGNVTCNLLADSIDKCIENINLTNHIARRMRYNEINKSLKRVKAL